MSLGIGNATPFSMRSNHATSYNHAFRDEAPYEAAKQSKIKCTYCGVWAAKGKACRLCGTQTKCPNAPIISKENNTTFYAKQQQLSQSRGSSPSASSRYTRSSSRSASHQSQGMQQQFVGGFYQGQQQGATTPRMKMGQAPLTPRQQGGAEPRQKVKCCYCGVWVQQGKMCSLCRSYN